MIWLALSKPAQVRLRLMPTLSDSIDCVFDIADHRCKWLAAGKNLHYLLIDLPLDKPLPADTWIGYQLFLQPESKSEASLTEWINCTSELCYPGKTTPGFILNSRVNALFHGSCRKPHHAGADGLVAADRQLLMLLEKQTTANVTTHDFGDIPHWPSFLMMSGDQVYVDDVAGPMLRAIHEVIAVLGLPDEDLPYDEQTGVTKSSELFRHPSSFYHREKLLPRKKRHADLVKVLFSGVEKPIFTTDSAHNHLISLAEMLTMYLLVWSPNAWSLQNWDTPEGLDTKNLALFKKEQAVLKEFVAGLQGVQRLFAHIPTAMIFDDHDITDDWNLSREWEDIAYGHEFSKRVIGNALCAYLVNQGWGNSPESFPKPLMKHLQSVLVQPGCENHNELIQQLLDCRQWHFSWNTSPPLVVLDTRTQRWRSEGLASRPSGLMDWEALTDLQHTLKDLPAVLLVSSTPIFGVKLIEAIQRLFTWFGKPLMVDAENWMAHPGAGHAILNIFRHPKTPQNFVILSGDVHYSFVYDVELRGRDSGPDIWQICSSGFRNTFPQKLLDWLDLANRWLYSPRSPLNWFTRRRRMRIIPRKPDVRNQGRRLLNGTGFGLVELNRDGVPQRISQIMADGRSVGFSRREEESTWE